MSVAAERPRLLVRLFASPELTRPAAITLAAVAAVLTTRAFGEYGNFVVITACVYMIVCAGLHVLVHWAGQVSLGQVAFVAIGAFTTARANADLGLPLPVALVAGMAAAVVASAVVGLPSLRVRGFALAIVTFAFGFAADRFLFIQRWLVPQASGVPLRDSTFFGFDIAQATQLVIPVLVITAVVIGLTVRLGESDLGRAVRVVAADEEVAASYGVTIGAHKVLAFLLAGACAGLAGGLQMISIGRAGPAVFPPTLSVLYLSAVLLGGRGPVWGSLGAAAALGAGPILAGGLGHFAGLVGPVSILLVVRFSADGLNGLNRRMVTTVRASGSRLLRKQEAT